MAHAFDRYAGFTDVPALKEISARPLRKSVRVNTLKLPVSTFVSHAESLKWTLTPVPWCSEAFFIDRENRETAIGKDLFHLIGGFYMQEAASMLPVVLLQPEPGDVILDMSAAPGSKTTQIAARMQGRGVIVANDVQEKRLWTLKNALHRSGVTNVLVVKKVGQWYAKHMTERFDRVLCDAPCTAQGTLRKDSDALLYSSEENTEVMARLQVSLLEAAIHATKTGGRIVYSTCTLTPEENEGVIQEVLNKFSDQLEVVDPRTLGITADPAYFEHAIADSIRVQETLSPASTLPLIRLWPQTYDTEGFFCAVLRKKAPTRDIEHMDIVPFVERELPVSRRREVAATIEKLYGDSFIADNETLFERGEALLLTSEETAAFPLPVADYSIGLPFGKLLADRRVRLSHEIVTLRGGRAVSQTIELTEQQLADLLQAKDSVCDPELRGDMVLLYKGMPIGLALAKEGKLKNNIPRWMVGTGERSHR